MNVGISGSEISTNKVMIQKIGQEIEKLKENLGSWEKIKRFELTTDKWTTESGHLTPTMKLKRKPILEKYQILFAKIYNPK